MLCSCICGFYLGKGRVSRVLRSLHFEEGSFLFSLFISCIDLATAWLHGGIKYSAHLILGEVAASSHFEWRFPSCILGHMKCSQSACWVFSSVLELAG